MGIVAKIKSWRSKLEQKRLEQKLQDEAIATYLYDSASVVTALLRYESRKDDATKNLKIKVKRIGLFVMQVSFKLNGYYAIVDMEGSFNRKYSRMMKKIKADYPNFYTDLIPAIKIFKGKTRITGGSNISIICAALVQTIESL